MAYSGLQINGSFDVSQEKGNTATTTNGQYICDGWLANASGTMVIYMIPSNSPGSFNGLPNSLYAQTTTAQASLAAGDYWVASQKIEGYRVARLSWGTSSAQPITIGFWTLFHVPGVYSGVIRNGALNRCYAFTYTHAAADVAQYNVITIPGDTTGTWASDNTTGMQIVFTFAAGSGNVAPSANSWLAGGYIAAPGQVNGASATTNTFRITGVIVLPGNEAPSAARSPFVMRPYDQELVTCKRYFEIQRGTHTHYVNGVGSWGGDPVSFKTEKRANPTVAPLNATGANCSGPTIGSISQWGFNWSVSIISAGGAFISFDWNADARL
jgi:hypothetical protein